MPRILSTSTSEAVVLVEGESDLNILETAWTKLFPKRSCPYEFRAAFGGSQIRTILNSETMYSKNSKTKLFAIFDFDKAYNEWTGTWKKDGVEIETDPALALTKKHKTHPAWAMLLPVPPFRKDLASVEFGGDSRLSIELLFERPQDFPGLISFRKAPGGGSVPVVKESKKTEFSEAVRGFASEEFRFFLPLFARMENILKSKTVFEESHSSRCTTG